MKKLYICDSITVAGASGSAGVSSPATYILNATIRTGDDLKSGTTVYVKGKRNSAGKIESVDLSFTPEQGYRKVATYGCVDTPNGYYVTIDCMLSQI